MTAEQAELERIYDAVEREFGFSQIALKASNKGSRELSAARRAVCVLMRERLGWSDKLIARELNRFVNSIPAMIHRTGCRRVSDETRKFHNEIENRVRAALRQ